MSAVKAESEIIETRGQIDTNDVKQPWQAATSLWADGHGLGPLLGDRMDQLRFDRGDAAKAF
jgi:hypothetical protein